MAQKQSRSRDSNLLRAIAKNTLSTLLATTAGNVLTGKPANGDFTTAYTSATTITAGGLPAAIPALADEDINAIVQYDVDGNFENIFTKDVNTMTVAANVITVHGAKFTATDTFIVYTNYSTSSSGSVGSILGTTSTTATLVTAADIGVADTVWIDQGAEIDCRTYSKVGIFIAFTVDDSTGNQIQILSKSASGGANEFIMDTAASYQKTIGNADIEIFYEFEVNAIIPYIQIQSRATDVDTGGGTIGTMTIYITRGY